MGWFNLTILQWFSLGVSMFMPTAPMYSVSDITSSSRIGSIGGFGDLGKLLAEIVVQ